GHARADAVDADARHAAAPARAAARLDVPLSQSAVSVRGVSYARRVLAGAASLAESGLRQTNRTRSFQGREVLREMEPVRGPDAAPRPDDRPGFRGVLRQRDLPEPAVCRTGPGPPRAARAAAR